MQHYDKQKRQQGLFATQQGVAPVRSSRLTPALVVVLHGGERELGTYRCDLVITSITVRVIVKQ